MKKVIPLLLGLAVSVCAADFWLTKPYTDWSDKDIQKLETNSPWSKQVPLSLGGAGGGPDTGRSRRGGSGSGGDLDSTMGSGGGGGRSSNPPEVGGGVVPAGGASMNVTVSWRSSLAFREAVAKGKFGAEAATSADAKKIVEDEPKSYMVLISGLPGRALHGNDKMKESLLQSTSLIVKGRDPIQPTDVQTGGNEQRPVLLFVFPKSAPLSLDDKDVEFSTKLGSIVVKQKFHLKDMMFNGKLDL
jgi:hypothetical protein